MKKEVYFIRQLNVNTVYFGNQHRTQYTQYSLHQHPHKQEHTPSLTYTYTYTAAPYISPQPYLPNPHLPSFTPFSARAINPRIHTPASLPL